jgi:putative MATE family efflux protein
MNDLTSGSIPRQIIGMATFIALGMIFQTLYFLVDLYFVSGLGERALAGVSTGGTATFLVLATTQMIAVGAVSLIARAVGRKDDEDANAVFGQALLLALVACAATLIVGYAATAPAMALMAADGATAIAGRDYLYGYLPALALAFPTAALSSGLRAMGVVREPTAVQVATVILNAALAPVLIAGWGTGLPLGPAGAGLASSIAAALGLVALVVMFPKVQTRLHLTMARLRPVRSIILRIVAVGLPASGEFFVLFTVLGGTYWVIRDFGPEAQAGYGLSSRLMQAVFLPALAVAFAVTPIAGQNFGANKPDRVRATFRYAVTIEIAFMLLLLTLLETVPQVLIGPFADNPRVVAIATDYFAIVSLNLPAQGLIMTCSGMFQALGSTRLSFFSSLSRIVTYMAPAMWMSTLPGIELRDFWYLSVASILIQAVVVAMLLRQDLARKLGDVAAPLVVDQSG